MTIEPNTLPIEFWDCGDTRCICPEDENGRTVEVKYFFNIQFTGLSKHYPQPLLYSYASGKMILPTVEKFMSLGRGTIYESDMKYSSDLPVFEKICDVPVFYFVYNMANYYHFIYDTLPYLYSYFNEKKIHPELKLLVSPAEGKDDLYSFIWECLELLNIKRSDVIFLNQNVLYKTVLVGSSLTHNRLSNSPPHKGVYEVIDRMKNFYKGAEKIYISRRSWVHNNTDNIGTNKTMERRCVNEDNVAKLFASYGFKEVFCELMTMKEKIGMFSFAKYIAGPIGGGMVNTIFSPPDTKVLSINSPTFFDINKRFEYSMSHTDLTHFNDTEFVGDVSEWVENDNSLSISGGLNSPWKVNLDKLSKFIKSWMIS